MMMDAYEEYLWELSKRVEEIADKMLDLNNQMQSWAYELKGIQHELGSYDADLDEPDLNGKEEFDRAVEGGDVDGTLP